MNYFQYNAKQPLPTAPKGDRDYPLHHQLADADRRTVAEWILKGSKLRLA